MFSLAREKFKEPPRPEISSWHCCSAKMILSQHCPLSDTPWVWAGQWQSLNNAIYKEKFHWRVKNNQRYKSKLSVWKKTRENTTNNNLHFFLSLPKKASLPHTKETLFLRFSLVFLHTNKNLSFSQQNLHFLAQGPKSTASVV